MTLKKIELYFYCLCAVALPYFYINTQAFIQHSIFNLAHKFNFWEFTFLGIEFILLSGFLFLFLLFLYDDVNIDNFRNIVSPPPSPPPPPKKKQKMEDI